MIQGIYRPILLKVLYCCLLIFMECLLQPSHENLELPELIQEWLVSKESNILRIIVGLLCCTAFVDFLEVLWLMRKNSLQNT